MPTPPSPLTHNATTNPNTSPFLKLGLFNIYIFSISIVFACLVLSLLILALVLFIIKRIERRSVSSSTTNNNSPSSKKKSPKFPIPPQQQTPLSNVSQGGSYFLPVNDNSDTSDSSSDDVDNSSSSSSKHRRHRHHRHSKSRHHGGPHHHHHRLKSCLCASLKRFSSFDSFDSYSNNTNTDSASVPVSRSVDHTRLCVYIYFGQADFDYASTYLLPCLHKCLTIIPDTRFVLRPQQGKYADVSAASGNVELDSQSTSTGASSVAGTTRNESMRTTTQQQSCLVARVLVISENFYGCRSSAANSDSLASSSLKLKSTSSSDRSLVPSKLYSRVNNNSSNHHHHGGNSESQWRNVFRIHLFNNSASGSALQRLITFLNFKSSKINRFLGNDN